MKLRDSFLIVGMARSGTKFLAKAMDKSDEWTVVHEAVKIKSIFQEIYATQKRLNQDYYGEVDSRLTLITKDLNIAKMGVIFRDPADAWLSIANKQRPESWDAQLERYSHFMTHMLLLIQDGALPISFKLMTLSPEYLKSIFQHFGIEDVDITDETIGESINATEKKRYTKMSDFDEDIQHRVGILHWRCQELL